MKSNNQYLRTMAQKSGLNDNKHHSDNFYLKRIAENMGTSDFSGSYEDLTDKPSTFPPSTHSHTVSDLSDFPTLEFVVITDDKGTASNDTMGKLYIVSENNKVNAYYSKENKGSYSWKQLDEDMLDNITIPTDVADLTDNNNTAFTPKAHTHTKSEITDFSHTHSEYLTEHQDITGKENTSNKSQSITTDTGSTTKYPSVKAIEDYIDAIIGNIEGDMLQ